MAVKEGLLLVENIRSDSSFVLEIGEDSSANA